MKKSIRDVTAITDALAREVDNLTFAAPVDYVYNPLIYAHRSHQAYLERYGQGPREVLLVGMNPGPFGMAQTGVPFGDVTMVRDWMGISEEVDQPPRVHPKRPVDGFRCARKEVSGTRLWGWAQDRFGSADLFFQRFFVINYCPLSFMEESSRNRTPDKLPAAERDALFKVCDVALRAMAAYFEPRIVLGVGQFAETRAQSALDGLDLSIGRILHPSPASPAANRGWAEAAEKDLAKHGVSL